MSERDEYTPSVEKLASALYRYDQMEDEFVYANERVQEQYLERALFIHHCDWIAQVRREAAAEQAEKDLEAVRAVLNRRQVKLFDGLAIIDAIIAIRKQGTDE